MKKEIVPYVERDRLPVVATPKPVSKLAGRLVQFARDVITPLPSPAGDEHTGRSVIESEAWSVFQSGVSRLAQERQARKLARAEQQQREQLQAAAEYSSARSSGQRIGDNGRTLQHAETADRRITLAIGLKSYTREEERPDGTIIREHYDF